MILYLPSTLHPNTNAETIADTGCTGHYFSITQPQHRIYNQTKTESQLHSQMEITSSPHTNVTYHGTNYLQK
eukprot:9175928-Ditylum_brightwellii.AAC.1